MKKENIFKKFFRSKKGDLNIFNLMVLPTLFTVFYVFVSLNSQIAAVEDKAQNALTSSALYLSSRAVSSTVGVKGEQIDVCVIADSADDQDLKNAIDVYVINGIISKIDGYHPDHWDLTWALETKNNIDVLTLTLTIDKFPVVNTKNYTEFYQTHPNWDKGITKTMKFETIVSCRPPQ